MSSTESLTRCADCGKPAVVGWSSSHTGFQEPIWVCADHFEERLDFAADLAQRVKIEAAPAWAWPA